MNNTPKVLVAQLLDLMPDALSTEVITMVCGPVPLDKAPWLRDDAMRVGATSFTTPEQSRKRVDTALGALVRKGVIVETEPGRYAACRRVDAEVAA